MQYSSVKQKLPIMLTLIAALATACGQQNSSQLNDTTVVSDSRYVDVITPWADFASEERREAVRAAQNMISQALRAQFPDSSIADGTASMFDDRSEEVADIVNNAQRWLQGNELNGGLVGMGITDLYPTGFIIFAGGDMSFSLKIGGGGTALLAFVFVPVKISRIALDNNGRRTGDIKDYWFRFRTAAVVMPCVNLGVGAGGGANWQVGAGLIWGHLTDPKEFVGVAVGASMDLDMGLGANLKAGVLHKGIFDRSQNNVFVLGAVGAGPKAGFQIHGTIAPVIRMDAMAKILGLDAEFVSNKPENE